MDLFLCFRKESWFGSRLGTWLLLAVSLVLFAGPLPAQLVYQETFDVTSNTFSLPRGWVQGRSGSGADPDNLWDRVVSGSSPSCLPQSGSGMLRFQARNINSGSASWLATKKLDMRTIPAGGAPVSFWMWRDNAAYTANGDRINVYVNIAPELNGTAVLLAETATSSGVINRSCALQPASPPLCNGWNQYNYVIPATYNTNSVYVIIQATSANGNNIFIDEFSVTSYPKTANQTLITSSAVVTNQNASPTQAAAVNQQIIGVKLTMDGSNNPRVLTAMEFNTNGSTQPSIDIQNAKLWYTGGTPFFSTENAVPVGTYNTPWLTNFMFLQTDPNYSGLLSLTNLDHGDNYFWVTYDVTPGARTGNLVDAEWVSFTLSGVNYIPTLQTLPGSRLIGTMPCLPSYTIGTSWKDYVTNDFIQRVVLAGDMVTGIDNNKNRVNQYAGPSCPGPFPADCPFQSHPPDYERFAAVPGKTTTLTANGITSYPIALQVGGYTSGNAIAAWIDFNGNNLFEPAEKIAQSGLLTASAFYNTTFTVPANAITGRTLMRVREVWGDINIDPCATRTYGETEDYTVTLVPDCQLTPGWTTWLGFSNDWSDASNWCPARAPIAANNPPVNVIIPGGPSYTGYSYNRPVIREGVSAQTRNLIIENYDTLYIDAPSSGSLTVLDSLVIRSSASAMIIDSSFRDTIQVLNGLLQRPADSPLNTSGRSRSFILLTQDELLSKGLRANDQITSLLFHAQRKSNGNAYKGLTVRYYYTNPGFNFTPGPGGFAPPQAGPAPVTIYSGDLSVATHIPVVNGWGTIELELTTPISWNGLPNQLVIEICYDNTGFPLTGANDELRFTQTISLKKYMKVESISSFPKSGCDIIPGDFVSMTASGTANSPVITVDPGMASQVYPGAAVIGSGPFNGSINSTVISVNGNSVTLAGNTPATFTNGTLTFYNTRNTSINFRPNISFRFKRPYIKYPVTVSGHWQNNGTFVPSLSRVIMNGTSPQKIEGASVTTFHDLFINNGNHVTRYTDFVVNDSLRLINGRLKLNNGMVTLASSSFSALTYVSGAGDIQAETDLPSDNQAPYGRLAWNMGATPGLRILPFINASGTRIPFHYHADTGYHFPVIGTYATLPDNTNIPFPDVTNIFGFNGTSWSSDGSVMADRYFHIDQSNSISPQADITFRYAFAENAQSGNSAMSAQRWIQNGSMWEFPFQPNQVFTPGAVSSVQLNDFSGFADGSWWAIVGTATPLPVSLLDFTARQQSDRVALSWTTASEWNNSHFIIERTTDHVTFDYIGRTESLGPGNETREYLLYDEHPLDGLQYYYLRQYDHDGTRKDYGPVFADFRRDLFDIVSTVPYESGEGVTVVFHSNSTLPVSYRIFDLTGRVITDRMFVPVQPGLNMIGIEAELSQGIYQLVLSNPHKLVTRKFLMY